MTAPRVAALILVAFAGGAAAVIYGIWLWLDNGLGKLRW